MASKDEQADLGRLILQAGLDVLYIKDVHISENVNEHGTMTVRFLTKAGTEQADAIRQQGSEVKLVTMDGESVFCGICMGVRLLSENEYMEAELTASTASVLTDKESVTHTYQGTGKTLESVFAQGIGRTALTAFEPGAAGLVVSEMLSQENETDWAFDRRIANQYGKQLFADSKTAGCRIHIGNMPFREMEPGIILNESVKRSVDKVRSLQGNNSPDASVFEYENTVLAVSNLAIGAGYTVNWQGRPQTVVKSVITCRQGLLRNELTLANAEGLSPSAEQFFATENISSILTGTVLEVDGNNVKVDFGSAGDAPRWIPYAHAVSNYFYSMPDEGDTVFVYYETGDSDKILCLGSRHVNDSPDFGRYQDKMLTADNRMVKFGDKTLELVGDRDEYDGYGWEQSKIIFNDEFGIGIQSTNEIRIETTDGGKITIQSVGQDFAGMDALRQTFEEMYGAGNDKYVADGGADMSFDALGLIRSRNLEGLKESIKGSLMAPFQLIGTVQELAGRIGGGADAEEPAQVAEPEEYTDGVVDIYGLDCLVLRVGNSSIVFANGIIQIKADSFMELGTDRSIVYEHLEDTNYTWKDMFLDVAQLALDIVGALPIPGLSTAANLINAGVSLARGDYVGAAMSAGTALASLIPGANSAIAAGKAAATAVAKGSKVMKVVSAVAKVVKALKTGAQTLNTILTTGMAIWDVGEAIIDGSFDWNDPDCRQDVFTILQAGGTMAQSQIQKNTITEDGKTRFMDKEERTRAKEKRRQARRDAVNKAKEGVRAKLDEYSANRCKNGEPIDMVTGSYLIEQCDFIINDISGIYAVERTYESLLAEEDSPVGRGWTLSLFSTAYIYDDRVEVVLPDSHTETFLRTEDGYRNRRGGTRRMELCAQEDGYLLTETVSGISRFYDMYGKLLQETDRNGNSRRYEYVGETLCRVSFASGQYLDFTWDGGHVQSIRDCIGRTVSYRYENGLLTETMMVTGGLEQYAYDTDGRVTDITDADGVTYVHNEYDRKGRVARQTLYDGQEYVMLYDDDSRTNTYLTPGSGREIRYTYDRSRRLVCTEYRDGTTQERRYDEWENIVWEKDRNGNVTQRTYDACGHLLEEERADGLKVSYEYDEAGNCLRMRDSGGRDIRYAYDGKGNLIKETEQVDDSRTRSVSYEYDRCGRVTAFTDANGHRETYRYDSGFWESTAFTTAGGSEYQHRLDSAGRCVAVTDADGESTYAYTNFDLVGTAADPMGNTTHYLYNHMADLTGLVRPNHYAYDGTYGARESYTNDAFHRRLSRTDCTGAVYAVHRDGEGNIIKEINPNAYDPGTNDGAGIEYVYDDYDRAVRVLYPDGGVLRRWYDPEGNMVKVCSPTQYDRETDSGAGHTYGYDGMGRPVQVTAPDGTVLRRYVYDLHGNVTKIIRADWMCTGETDEERTGELYAYNLPGWLMESRIPVSVRNGETLYRLTKYQYDGAGNRIRERRFCEYQTRESESGVVHTIDYAYDADDRLIRVSDCTGAVLEYRYDGNNRRIFEKRRINGTAEQIFRYTYDAGGRMTALNRTADREGCGRSSVSVKYEYDRNGNNTRTTLPTGAQILREYDAADRLVSERHLDSACGIDNTTRFAYDKAGNLISITDNLGRSTRIEYDLMNREIKRTERDGSVTRQFYDPDGQPVKVIRPNEYARAGEDGKGVQYTYDAQGRVLTVIAADGSVRETNAYDAEGNLIHTRDGMGNGADMEYDLGGRRTKIATTGKAGQQYEYDALGNVTGITDGAGNRTEYILDKWGRIVEILRADGSSEFYGYDHAGNIIRTTDGEGNTTAYEYNAANLLAVMTDPTGQRETYRYDAQDRLCGKTDRNGTEIKYSHNLYNSLTERRARKTDGTELIESYRYTPEGLLESAISQGMRYSYAYDMMGRLTEKKASGRTLLAFEYDLNGNLTRQTDVTGKVTEYTYNVLDLVEKVTDNGTTTAEYGYYPDGSVRSLRNGSLYTEYVYDADRNLTGLKTMLGTDIIVNNRYTYDGNGNRLEKLQKHGVTTYGYDNMKRLVKVEYPNATEELFYDKAGNRTKRLYNGTEELYRYDPRNRLTEHIKGGVSTQYEYDNAGNLLKDDRARYEYDAFNRNTKVETFDGNIQINRYDAEGLRHEMEENGKLVTFIFRGDEVVTEESQEDRIRYIRTGVLLASDAESARTYYHYASDEMSSITHVVEGTEVLNHYEYDAWGNLTTCEEKVQNRFKFNGQQYDSVTQQYYLRARYYNPVIGRFTQEDTYNVDGLNLYAYCRNNPVYYVDPSGNICDSAAQKIMDKFSMNGNFNASRNEQKKLAAYLRNKDRNGTPLTPMETRILNQINDYTYLPRNGQDVPSHIYTKDDKDRWHRPNGQYASNAEMGLPAPNRNSSNGEKNRYNYMREWHDNRVIQIYGDAAGGRTVNGQPGRRIYDAEYQVKPGLIYDIEFKSDNFANGPRSQAELDHIDSQIAKDIAYRDAGMANPYWHFDHDPTTDPDMITRINTLESHNIPWSSGPNNPFE